MATESIPEENKSNPTTDNSSENKDDWIPLTEDRGVLKKILVEGVGEETPPQGANVECHYVGTLVSDGSKFDSSRDRDAPFKFAIGKGNVIKAWDIGIATMKRQEKCILRCRYDYAYGEQGSGGSIPPRADLDFEVEMIDWNDWEDVKNDGTLWRRKIISSEEHYKNPREFAKCKVSYVGKLVDTGMVFVQGENDEITLHDDNRFPSGFHEALTDMTLGEKCEFKMSPSWAFGSQGNEQLKVPPHSYVSYVITLHSYQDLPELWEMSTEEHFAEAEKFKTLGNDAFRAEAYPQAIKRYERALKAIKHDNEFNDEEKQRSKRIASVLNCNLALVYFKQKDYKECLTKVDESLTDDPNNIKALVRRGQTNMQMGNNDLAKEDFKKASALDPNNADVKKLMAANKKRIQEHKEKERKLFGNMFQSKPKSKNKSKETKNVSSGGDTTGAKEKKEEKEQEQTAQSKSKDQETVASDTK